MVLSIYYLTMSDDTLSTLNVNSDVSDATDVVISEENDTLVALKVADEEELLARTEELESILLSDTATLQEKNDAYEKIIRAGLCVAGCLGYCCTDKGDRKECQEASCVAKYGSG